MAQLRERVLAERENVELALANLGQAMARTDRTVVELTAAASFVSSVYSGIENILKQVLAARSIEIPRFRSVAPRVAQTLCGREGRLQ